MSCCYRTTTTLFCRIFSERFVAAMRSRPSCFGPRIRPATDMRIRRCMRTAAAALLSVGLIGARMALAGDAPGWMHAQLAAPLPPHDDKTAAVVLYAETVLSVQPNGKMKRLDRQAIKILRPDGEARGT